jgi:mannose-6-phosphate isomerase-like protein (cupin superfamily)
MKTERPWGAYWVTTVARPDVTPIAATKILRIDAGQSLSLQVHRLREEHWFALSPGLVVTHGPMIGELRQTALAPETTFVVPAGWLHSIANPTDRSIGVIETMFGEYDEDDIVRLSDQYGRA